MSPTARTEVGNAAPRRHGGRKPRGRKVGVRPHRQQRGNTCHYYKCRKDSVGISPTDTLTQVWEDVHKAPHVVSKSESMNTASEVSRGTGQTLRSTSTGQKTTWPYGPLQRAASLQEKSNMKSTVHNTACRMLQLGAESEQRPQKQNTPTDTHTRLLDMDLREV